MKLSLPLVFGLVLSAISAHGDIQVQFGLGTSPTQPGYSLFTAAATNGTGSLTQTFSSLDVNIAPTGTVTVSLVGGPTSTNSTLNYAARDRNGPKNGGSLSYGPLYESFAGFRLTPDTYGWLSLSGLKPNATFVMTFYAYDNDFNGNMTFTDDSLYTPTNNLAGKNTTITYTHNYDFASDTNADSHFSSPLTITTDTNGNAVIQITGVNNNGPTALINALGPVNTKRWVALPGIWLPGEATKTGYTLCGLDRFRQRSPAAKERQPEGRGSLGYGSSVAHSVK